MTGICSYYRQIDSTRAALSVADHCASSGKEFALYHYGWRAAAVDPNYDHMPVELSPHLLDGSGGVLWADIVEAFFFAKARRPKARHVLYTSWDQIDAVDEILLPEYSHVLLPTVAQATRVRDKFRLKNVAVLPFFCGQPVTRKDGVLARGRVTLCVSLYGQQMRRVDGRVFATLMRLLDRHKHLSVWLGRCAGLSPKLRRCFKNMEELYPGRWRNFGNSWGEHVDMMARADVTVWAPRWDGFGLIGLTSLHLGTPVYSWNAAPFNEYLCHGDDAFLVDCEVDYNWLGVPRVVPDYDKFEDGLCKIVYEVQPVLDMQRTVPARLYEWDREFKKGMAALFPS